MFKRSTLTLLLLAALAAPAWAASAAQFDAAYRAFDEAQRGDTGAIDLAAERFAQLALAEPGDMVLLAYAGATEASRARTTWLPWRKMQHAEDGLARIDKALAQLKPADDAMRYHGTPASLEARFTAASTFLALPATFNRRERGEKLLAQVQDSPLFTAAPAGFRGAVWWRAAQHAAEQGRTDEARTLWQRIVQSGAPQAALAATRLSETRR